MSQGSQRAVSLNWNPSVRDFKNIICMNGIKNNPVTIEDINISEKIYGPDIGMLKGKSTKTKALPIVNDYVEIPQELYNTHENVTLFMDTLFINGLTFLATISENIKYCTIKHVPNKKLDTYRSVIDRVLQLYNTGGFYIKKICCNNEYKEMMEPIKDDLDIDMDYVPAQEHVKQAERNNRTMKERIRAAYHRLLYKQLPKEHYLCL